VAPSTRCVTPEEIERVIDACPDSEWRLLSGLARFDDCSEGEERLITIGGKGAVIRLVRRIWARAGVEPWSRLWQTLRSSCEKEWAMTFPQYAVSKWIGHSITVSGRHYANAVPDELLDKAASMAGSAQRNAQRKAHETGGNGKNDECAASADESRNSRSFRELRDISTSPCGAKKWSRGDSNPRPETVSAMPLRV